MRKEKRSPILICTSERASYRRLVTVGEAMAKEESRPLSVLAIQPRELVSPNTAESIQILHNIVSGTGAEITILFSDSPILSFSVFAKQINASQVLIDEESINGKIQFHTLRDLLAEIPLSVLPKNGRLVTFPPQHEMHTIM